MKSSPTTIGMDTGFFVRLDEHYPSAVNAWQRIIEGRAVGVISCVSIYELQKLGLRGRVEKNTADALIEDLSTICRVVWLTGPFLLRQAARISHGNNIAMADALILVSLMDAGADVVYTTDHDLERYTAGPDIHVLSSS